MKTYSCPYCTAKLKRPDLVKHIDKEHDDMLPVNYTAYRMVYDIVNNKQGHGICTQCGKDTKWNEAHQKYDRICDDPKCAKAVRDAYCQRMLKVHNKIHLLDDPKQQEKMLASRKISGTYTWADGTKMTYTGKFEKSLMEFLEKAMNYASKDVVAPGPILEYTFKGKKHHWITDFLLVPHNLIIEVKDGGDNPNKRSMPEYRAKQVAKEKMITNLGTFSYLRLTNNNFGQLLGILAEMKKQMVDDLDKVPLYRINEMVDIIEDTNSSIVYNMENTAKRLYDGIFSSVYESYRSLFLEEECISYNEDSEENTMFTFARVYPKARFNNAVALEALLTSYDNLVTVIRENVNSSIDIRYRLVDEYNPNDGIYIGLLDKC